jgi:hypothetical protein
LQIDGTAGVGVAISALGWQDALRAAFRDIALSERWRLEPYLAKTAARDGRSTVDFTICNREQARSFNGSFRLLLAERHALAGGDAHYWVARQEIVQDRIDELRPAAIVGCAFPERFELPAGGRSDATAIIAIVYDAGGRVQALLREVFAPTAGDRP